MTMDESPRRRPRISLLSLLLLTGMIASWITTAMLWREIRPLRAEVRRLHEAANEPFVEDRSKVYVRSVSHDYLGMYSIDEGIVYQKYRVYLPEGRGYRVMCSTKGVPGFERLSAGDALTCSPGDAKEVVSGGLGPGRHEIVVRCCQLRDQSTGILTDRVRFSATVDTYGTTVDFRSESPEQGETLLGIGYDLSYGKAAMEPSKVIVLVWREMEAKAETGKPSEEVSNGAATRNGAMLWIEPLPDPAPSR